MQELRVLKRDGLRYQPKTVIWFFFEGNDLYDDHGFDNTLLAAPPSPEEMRAHPQGFTRHHGWRQRSFSLALLRQLRRWSTSILPSHVPYFGWLSQRVRMRVSSTLQTMRTYLGPTGCIGKKGANHAASFC